MLIGEDFNARTRSNGGRTIGLSGEKKRKEERKSKDCKVNREAKRDYVRFYNNKSRRIINADVKKMRKKVNVFKRTRKIGNRPCYWG